jgi:hypothetical protein
MALDFEPKLWYRPRLELTVAFAAFSQTGQRQVVLMLVFLRADSSKTNPPDHHFEPSPQSCAFLIVDYVFFVIVHDVVSDIITTLFRG